ncbi:hypothetical protein PUV54_03840 [Hyphococcus flavus]|uniref:Antifreeze protein n=1 Tax=Hyphococcus flavus TaxID=1866326 RepID=A0AAF0CGL4_9PROT|nr:hypothetical protein [Hyphococcus flavus]WDI32323.1 hypothetical protein PUV54_03840 [Hyphococcus flavus]
MTKFNLIAGVTAITLALGASTGAMANSGINALAKLGHIKAETANDASLSANDQRNRVGNRAAVRQSAADKAAKKSSRLNRASIKKRDYND